MTQHNTTNTEIRWRAAEYEYVQKPMLWYVLAGGVTVILTGIALWQQNFFFAIFIVLAGITLITLGRRRPRVLEFMLDDEGVHIGKHQSYDYENIEGFDIHEYDHRLDELVIKRKATVNPFLRLPIDSQLKPKAIELLEQHLTRDTYEESFIDTMSRMIGF